MSASAPAGTARKNIGTLVAACTAATTSGEAESVVINHAALTSFIHVPTFDTTVAIHSARNSGSASGANADGERGAEEGMPESNPKRGSETRSAPAQAVHSLSSIT